MFSIISVFVFLSSVQAADSVWTLKNPETVHKSQAIAVLSSAVIPGGGQFYTGNRFKGILFLTTETALLTMSIIEWRKGDKAISKNYDEYLYHYDRYRNFLWIFAGVKALSLGDAYISAYLYRFEQQGTIRLVLNLSKKF